MWISCHSKVDYGKRNLKLIICTCTENQTPLTPQT